MLDKRAGLSFAQLDVFVNVVGGVRLQEPAGDLAVAAALASSVYDRALPHDAVFVGEVGLGGEVRAGVAGRASHRRSREHGTCERVYLGDARRAEARVARRRSSSA